MDKESCQTSKCQTFLIFATLVLLLAVIVLGFYVYKLSNDVALIQSKQQSPQKVIALSDVNKTTDKVIKDYNQRNDFNSSALLQTMQQMQEQMNQVMDQTFYQMKNNFPPIDDFIHRAGTTPSLTLKRKDNRYIIITNIPKSEKNLVNITLKNQILTISGDVSLDKTNENKQAHLFSKQHYNSHFSQHIVLPKPVLAEAMSTHYKNDRLVITIPIKKNQ